MPDDLAKPKASINVTGLFESLVGRAERQASIEQRRVLALERGEYLPGDIDADYEDLTDLYSDSAYDENGKLRFMETARTYRVVYDSKEHNPGIGYPSCSRALARIVHAHRDPNGYYAYIGVLPSATMREVRKALRMLYQKFHPDGWAPDPDEFEYIREISEVLLDERRRMRYDNLEPGEKWVDSRVRKEMQDSGILDADDAIAMDFIRQADDEPAWSTMRRTSGEMPDRERPETVSADGQPRKIEGGKSRAEAMHEASERNGYDFFAEPLCPGDQIRAQLWYEYLHRVAPLVRYTRPMRVWIYGEAEPYWSDIGGIMKIPRTWKPSSANAFALFKVTMFNPPGRNPANVGDVR